MCRVPGRGRGKGRNHLPTVGDFLCGDSFVYFTQTEEFVPGGDVF